MYGPIPQPSSCSTTPTPRLPRRPLHDMYSPYFPRGHVRLNPNESADVLELMAAVGLTRRGRVIGVVGAHGGAGTSTLAAWLARLIAADEECALVDVERYLQASTTCWRSMPSPANAGQTSLGKARSSPVGPDAGDCTATLARRPRRFRRRSRRRARRRRCDPRHHRARRHPWTVLSTCR